MRLKTIMKLKKSFYRTTKRIFTPKFLVEHENENEIIMDTNCEPEYKSFDEIPGPKSYYLLGTLPHYLPAIGKYSFKRLNQTYEKMHHEYGDIVKEKISKDRILVHLFDPKEMMAVYRNEGLYPERVSHRALARYRLERDELYSGPGLFPSNNEEWLRLRRLFQDQLFDAQNQKIYSEALEEVADDLVEAISVRLDKKGELNVLPLLYRFGLESIGNVALDKRLGCLSLEENPEADALVKAAEDTHMSVYLTENIPFNKERNYKKLVAAQDVLSKIVGKHFEEALLRKVDINRSCIVQKFKEVAEKKDMYTMLSDFFLAGIDTTAYAMCFSLYHLARNKKTQATLRSHLKETYPHKRTRMTGIDRPRYLRNVLSEVFRLNPVAIGTGRVLSRDLVLSGYMVPAGTMVILQHQVAAIQERYFKDARTFKPERWVLRETPSAVSAPFGGGRRLCFGRQIAQMEIYMALAKIIRNYELSYHYGDVNTINRLINVPEKPIKIQFEKL